MMERELRELGNIHKTKKKLFSKCLEKLPDRQKSLSENDLVSLRESIRKINFFTQEAMAMENDRKNVIGRISENLNLDINHIASGKHFDRLEGYNFEKFEHLRNAVRDRLDHPVDQLSIRVNVSVLKQPSGSHNILMGGMARLDGTSDLEIDNSRESLSGVSLDEEMTNMIQFQHAYEAAARVISVMDSALNTVINEMGLRNY